LSTLKRLVQKIFGKEKRSIFHYEKPRAPGNLVFALPEQALEFACTIAPSSISGLVTPAVIDDVEFVDGVGPIASVRFATANGVKSGLAVFPSKEDRLGATSRITDLCAVLVGPSSQEFISTPPMLVAAILKPEFNPIDGTWIEKARLGQRKN